MKTIVFKSWHVVYLILLQLVLAMGGYGLMEYSQLKKARASYDWPSTQGTVIRSWVLVGSRERRSSSSPQPFRGGRSNAMRTSGGGPTRHLQLTYTYSVKDKRYKGKLIRYGSFSPDPDEMVKRYPKGRAVTVYYDPRDPKNAVLERGVPLSIFIVLAVTGGAMGLWVLFGLFYLPIAIGRGRARIRLNNQINQTLRNLGFSFRPGRDTNFGAEVDALSDEMPFSLLVSREDVEDPRGIAVMERNGRLVELRNAGVPRIGREAERPPLIDSGFLVHIAVETRWMRPEVWEKTGRETDRPLTPPGGKGASTKELFFLCLGARYLRPLNEDWLTNVDWIMNPEADIDVPWFYYGLKIDSTDERYELRIFDTGEASFDDFFLRRRGGQLVREILTRPEVARQVMPPLALWKKRLFDLHVGQTVDAWLHLEDPVDWDDFQKELPKLLAALTDFTERMEQVLLAHSHFQRPSTPI